MADSLQKRQRAPPETGVASPIIADLLLHATQGVFVVDASQRIIFWNPASERFLGIAASQALGNPCYRLIHGCDIQGRPVCGPACHILEFAKGGTAPATFALSIDDGRGQGKMEVSTVLAPSPRDGLWAVVHVLHRGDATTGSSAAEPRMPRQPDPEESTQSESCCAPADMFPLTAREQRIIRLLAEGCAPGAISRELCISRATVRNHTQHILAKLGLHSKLEAVAYAYRRGLIKPALHA